jgi:hypothetical protein
MNHGCRAAVGLMLVLPMAGFAQTTAPVAPPPPLAGSIASHPDWPAAKPEDVKSIDAIVAAVYECISGPAGKARDWERFRSLMLPDGRLMAIREPRAADPRTAGAPQAHNDTTPMSVDAYVAQANTGMVTSGFFERGIANKVEAYANMAEVWSTYESRRSKDDAKPFARGINSFQLMKDGDRYWIVQIFWDAERPDTPIPAKYLP